MLTYSPKIYPNELLYSLIARYHHQSGNPHTTQTLKDIFNTTKVPLSIDLQINLNNISTVHNPNIHIDILTNNTLYNFYTFFINKTKRNLIKDKMLKGTTVDVHNFIGIKSSSINKNKFIKYCPACNKESYDTYGEYYWNRIFQIPGVNFCPYHKIKLLNSTVPTLSKFKYFFYTANNETCKDTTIISYTSSNWEVLQNIYNSIIMINNHVSSINNIKTLRKVYINRLIELNLAYPSGLVKQNELAFEFKNYYGTDFLDIINANTDFDKETSWLRSIVRPHSRINHYPTFHLLLIKFLGLSLDNLITRYLEIENKSIFYPCLNKVCKNYLIPSINSWILKNNTHGKYYYTLSCPYCGFTYCKYDLCDTNHYDFIKDYGQLWRQNLIKLNEGGLSYRQIANVLNVSHPTISKQLNLLSMNSTNRVINVNSSISGNSSIQSSYKPPKNWDYVDKQISHELNVRNLLINNIDYPTRITKELLCKKIGKRSYISQNISRLPLTNQFLTENTESVEQFYKRKIDIFYKGFVRSNTKVTIPLLLYNANIKKNYHHVISKYICNKYNL